MSKDLACKWNFIERNEASQEQGREDSSFDYFKDKERCLVREYIQNSMDAYSCKNGFPYVRVEFSFGELLCSDYPELLQSLPSRLKACSDYCQGNNAKDPYAEKYEYLSEHLSGTIGYLKVSDYNTKGMPYDFDRFKKSKFKSCVRSANSSHKDSGNAGGSHGKGKTVGFVNSNINAVYYSTKTEDGNCYGEGVIKLCDHIYNDENGEPQIYEDVAFYDSQSGKHPDTNNIPEDFRRTETGTDAYVLGIEETEEYVINMKKEVLRSFFKAIKEDLLRVIVCGEEFNTENIADKLLQYFEVEGEFDSIRTRTPEVEFNPRPYYTEALCKAGADEDHRIFNTEVDFPGEFLALGKTFVYFWKSDSIKQANSRDSVVYMRNNNMAIEVKRGRNNRGYYAVFVCEGDGSENLRHMENVTHDKWDAAEVVKDQKTKANKILAEIKQLMIKCEMVMFPEEEGQEKTINSLKNRRISLLGNNKTDDEESMWPSSNVTEGEKSVRGTEGQSSILETVSGKRKKKKAKGKTTIPESDPTPSVTPIDTVPNLNPSEKEEKARIKVVVNNASSTTGKVIEEASGKASYTVNEDGSVSPQTVEITISASNYRDVAFSYKLKQTIEKGYTHTVVIESVVMESASNPPLENSPKPHDGIPTTPATPTVEGEGETEGNTNEVHEGGSRMREIKIDGRHRHLIPLHDGEYACKLVLNVTKEYNDCKLELFVQGVSGKMPLKLRNVSEGCKKGGIDDNEIYGFSLIPGNNEIKFTPSESVKIYTLIIKAYGN